MEKKRREIDSNAEHRTRESTGGWGWKVVLLVVLMCTGTIDIVINKAADLSCAVGSPAFDKVG